MVQAYTQKRGEVLYHVMKLDCGVKSLIQVLRDQGWLQQFKARFVLSDVHSVLMNFD